MVVQETERETSPVLFHAGSRLRSPFLVDAHESAIVSMRRIHSKICRCPLCLEMLPLSTHRPEAAIEGDRVPHHLHIEWVLRKTTLGTLLCVRPVTCLSVQISLAQVGAAIPDSHKQHLLYILCATHSHTND